MSESPGRKDAQNLNKESSKYLSAGKTTDAFGDALKITKLAHLGPKRREFASYGLLTVKGRPAFLARELAQALGERGDLAMLQSGGGAQPRDEAET